MRTIQWFDDPTAIRTRLLRLLEPPLTFDHETPIWWWRDGNMHIEEFSIQANGRYLMDITELDIRRIAAVPGGSYWRSFVYVETAALPPSGAYKPNPEGSKQTIETIGYDYEEYAIPPQAALRSKTNCKTEDPYASIHIFTINCLGGKMVGVRGFEPPAPSSRTRCATRLRYTPTWPSLAGRAAL